MANGYNFIIALTGKSGAGKDALAHGLSEHSNLEFVVSTTSRPKRSGEVDGEDYHFVSDSEFQKLIDGSKLVEHRSYNTIENGEPAVWHYGIKHCDINLDSGSYVCVVDLEGLSHLKEEYGNKVISVYIETEEKIRTSRAMERDKGFDLQEWSRRIGDDFLKFFNVSNIVDITVKNNTTLEDCLEDLAFQVDYAMKLIIYYSQYASY